MSDEQWVVTVGGVAAGTIADRELRKLEEAVATDWRVMIRQAGWVVLDTLRMIAAGIGQVVIAAPFVAVWLIFLMVLADPHTFGETVTATRYVLPSEIGRFASGFVAVSLAGGFLFVLVRGVVIVDSSYVHDAFEAELVRRLCRHLCFNGSGPGLTFWRLHDGKVHTPDWLGAWLRSRRRGAAGDDNAKDCAQASDESLCVPSAGAQLHSTQRDAQALRVTSRVLFEMGFDIEKLVGFLGSDTEVFWKDLLIGSLRASLDIEGLKGRGVSENTVGALIEYSGHIFREGCGLDRKSHARATAL